MFAPTKALMMKGVDMSEETRPRHLSVVISAMMTCVSSCSPLKNRNVSERFSEMMRNGNLRTTHRGGPLRAMAGSPPDTSSLKQSYVIVYHEACGESLLIDSYVLYMIYTRLVQSLHDYFPRE